ncbi:protein EXECUTER 2, chloroplastic-like [Chenopodium quinoa]|uniref:protein EXECUTER 2, chloroplastic-like n=1 Tax=Chenopodium quinoa TaxID=63459 RepID=UPI000B79039A|nr:protein EXECUTER 2, chloroplastic-like [Chenopodium quinoa]
MAMTSPWGMGRTIPLPQTTGSLSSPPSSSSSSSSYNFILKKLQQHHINSSSNSVSLRNFLGHPRFFSLSNLCCRCNISNNENYTSISNSINSSNDWDWNRWNRHFSEIEQAESFSSVLKFQLEEAVEKEDFEEAAKLKAAIVEATSKDTVAEIMSELKNAIAEERYHDASMLSKSTGSGLVGWWIGNAKDSDDPFGRLVRITPGVGKFIGRTYTPRQLVTASPGTTLFEIYVVKDTDGTYAMQVVYIQRSKGNQTSSASLQPKPTRESPNSEAENSSAVDDQANKDKAEKQEEKILNIEGATEEGIKSVINFLKDKIPGLNVKVMNISIGDQVVDSDAVKQLTQEDSEEDDENSDDEVDKLDEVEGESDGIRMEGDSDSSEDEKDLDMKVFVGGIVHNEDDVLSKEDYIRSPAEISDTEKDSFILHIPGIGGSEESLASNVKVAALAAQGVSDLMPSDVAKAFLGSEKISPKVSKNVREIVKLAVSQAQKKSKLTEYTKFNRIQIPRGNLDPFDGLYVGSFGPYGTEIVQLRRKFGHWNNGNELEDSSGMEFFEYVEAVKLTGDLNVPAGQVTFRAKIGRGSRLSNRSMYPDELGVVTSYKGQGRIAEFGFKNPKWVEGELLQLNGKGVGPYFRGADLGFLYVVPEQSFLVLFNRLNLPE